MFTDPWSAHYVCYPGRTSAAEFMRHPQIFGRRGNLMGDNGKIACLHMMYRLRGVGGGGGWSCRNILNMNNGNLAFTFALNFVENKKEIYIP